MMHMWLIDHVKKCLECDTPSVRMCQEVQNLCAGLFRYDPGKLLTQRLEVSLLIKWICVRPKLVLWNVIRCMKWY